MKYLDVLVGFREFPDEIALCINISNCKFHCSGCHSPELWENVGTVLNQNELAKLIGNNQGITLVGFMGGKPKTINTLAAFVKNGLPYNLKVGWYWGGFDIPPETNMNNFDYIKIGPYIKELGGLDNPKTNQKMYQISKMETGEYVKEDITFKFWK